MSRSILIAVLLFGLFAIVQCNVHIRRFGDPETTTNQYLVWDDDNTYVLVDAGFGLLNNTEALIGNITEIGANRTTLRMIFLTHSHPDHFGGVPILALSFPNTPIVVADRETKNEIIVAAAANFPDIEYNWGSIQIYNTRFEDIFNEVSIKPVTGLPRAESERYVMLLNRDYNWIITGDVLNARSHAYLGETVDIQSLRNWYVIALGTLDVGGVLGLDQFTIYYPGRGLATSQDKIQEQIEYLQTFEQLVGQCSNLGQPFYSLSDVQSEMADRYPKYTQRNLLNEIPRNPNWVQFQASLNCTADEVNHSSVLYAPFFVVAALCFMLL